MKNRGSWLRLGALLLGISACTALVWWCWVRGSHDDSFLVREPDYYIEDDVAGFVHRAHVNRTYPWPEYARGVVHLTTNNLGFREDEDTTETRTPGVVRILVTGDSQIDGVVDNVDSFPNVLERMLVSTCPDLGFEVINGGCGYYGPDNYLGFVQKYLYLDADLHIIVLFAGNDFYQALVKEHAPPGAAPGPSIQHPRGYLRTLRKALREHNGPAIAQGLNQIYFFKHHPQRQQEAVDSAASALIEAGQLCADADTRLLVALLPTPMDVDTAAMTGDLGAVSASLGLTESDLGTNRRLTEQLRTRLLEHGIPTVDLYAPMLGDERRLFWALDYHLDDVGQQVLAEEIRSSGALTHSCAVADDGGE